MTDRDAYISRRVASFVYVDGMVERSGLGEHLPHQELIDRLRLGGHRFEQSAVVAGIVVERSGAHSLELGLHDPKRSHEIRPVIERAFPELQLEADTDWSLG